MHVDAGCTHLGDLQVVGQHLLGLAWASGPLGLGRTLTLALNHWPTSIKIEAAGAGGRKENSLPNGDTNDVHPRMSAQPPGTMLADGYKPHRTPGHLDLRP